MKLIRFGKFEKEKPGICIDEENYDASAFGEDYNEQFFETGGLKRLEKFQHLKLLLPHLINKSR